MAYPLNSGLMRGSIRTNFDMLAFSHALNTKHQHYLCAVDKKVVVGFCSLSIRSSLALGRSTAEGSVQPSYAATQRLIRTFKNEFGARDCKSQLDGCDLGTPKGQAMFKEQQLHQRCLKFRGKAAEIAALSDTK